LKFLRFRFFELTPSFFPTLGICPVEESLPGKGGVGLGFTIEELERAQWCMIEDAEGF